MRGEGEEETTDPSYHTYIYIINYIYVGMVTLLKLYIILCNLRRR